MNQYLTPDEVEVGRRNLIAELKGGLMRTPDVVELDASTVRDLIAVLEASKPTVVDRAELIAERDGENSLGPWLEEVFSTDEDSISWEQAAQALFDLGAVREAQVPTLSAVKDAIRTGLGGDTEEGCACESHICSAADAVLAALYPKATEGKL